MGDVLDRIVRTREAVERRRAYNRERYAAKRVAIKAHWQDYVA